MAGRRFGSNSQISKVSKFSKETDKNKLFRYTFLLLSFSLIFPVTLSRRKLTKKKLLFNIIFCITVFLSFAYSISAYWIAEIYSYQPKTVGNLFATLIASFNRSLLCFKLQSLQRLSSEIPYRRYQMSVDGCPKSKWIVIWILSTLAVSSTVIITQVTEYYTVTGIKTLITEFLIMLKFQDLSIIMAYVLLLYLLIMPPHTFTVFYFLVCSEIRCILKEYRAMLRFKIPSDYPALYKKLLSVEETILSANDCLESLVFVNVLFTGSLIYYAVTAILHPETYQNFSEKLSAFVLCSFSFISFLTMMSSAISVNDLSHEISKEAKVLEDARGSDVVTQVRFHLSVKEEMAMNIWAMGPAKRDLILSIFGSIFTYSILLDGIWSMKQNF